MNEKHKLCQGLNPAYRNKMTHKNQVNMSYTTHLFYPDLTLITLTTVSKLSVAMGPTLGLTAELWEVLCEFFVEYDREISRVHCILGKLGHYHGCLCPGHLFSPDHEQPSTVLTSYNYHHSDVIMSVMAFQITDVSIVYWTVCSGSDQSKRQSSASLAFVRGIHRWPVNSPHKGPVTRKCFHLMTSSWQIYLYVISNRFCLKRIDLLQCNVRYVT